MKKEAIAPVVTAEPAVHYMKKSHMLVSTRHIDLENLDAFEAVSMTAVFVLAVVAGCVLAATSGAASTLFV